VVQVLLDDYSAVVVAVDLVNSAPEVAISTGDLLPDGRALQRFLDEHRIALDALDDGRRPTAADLAAVHGLRRDLRELIDSTDVVEAVARAGHLVATGATGPVVELDAAGHWRWQVRSRPGVDVADELAVLLGTGLLSAIRVLGHDRFRQCAAPDCNGAFVDISRSGRRRYCVPEVCGNRVNVANHRARRRAAEPPVDRTPSPDAVGSRPAGGH
jgi:predicted RNA-binding Zn ribbon-like protein